MTMKWMIVHFIFHHPLLRQLLLCPHRHQPLLYPMFHPHAPLLRGQDLSLGKLLRDIHLLMIHL
jgi:hypothetical protein